MKITNDVLYVGVNDRKIDLFEGQYVVPEGMAYCPSKRSILRSFTPT